MRDVKVLEFDVHIEYFDNFLVLGLLSSGKEVLLLLSTAGRVRLCFPRNLMVLSRGNYQAVDFVG